MDIMVDLTLKYIGYRGKRDNMARLEVQLMTLLFSYNTAYNERIIGICDFNPKSIKRKSNESFDCPRCGLEIFPGQDHPPIEQDDVHEYAWSKLKKESVKNIK